MRRNRTSSGVFAVANDETRGCGGMQVHVFVTVEPQVRFADVACERQRSFLHAGVAAIPRGNTRTVFVSANDRITDRQVDKLHEIAAPLT